jgi:hypothetical protein
MRLAKSALLASLTMLALVFTMSAQTLRLESDTRNTAPTVGTGGPVGGPTGLFTVYDGTTLRKGEYTFSAAYSNFDRDPGNADFTELPVSFQIGVSDHLELFFNTDAYRGIKVNSPRNLSSFYLPNSQLRNGTTLSSGGAIVLGNTTQTANSAVFRPIGAQPFVQFPYVGGSGGTAFPFLTTLGSPRAGGGADLFPGVGSTFGGILPGVVLQTACALNAPAVCTSPNQFGAVTATIAPTYLPDAPFINRQYGQSAFSTFSAGAKWRWTAPENPIGVGVTAYYRWYADTASDASGFNQLQRGASPGGSRGDVGVVMFADARVRPWMNLSANLGYNYNSSIKGEFPTGTFTLLDRPDEVLAAIAADFPVNKYFQPILEFRTTQYVGGRTPNAFENSPVEALAGARWYPTRWMSVGGWYRYHANQQDRDSLKDDAFNTTSIVGGLPRTVVSGGIPVGFVTSTDPHGYGMQLTIGRRNSRSADKGTTPKAVSDVTEMNLDSKVITNGCPPGTRSKSGCSDDRTIGVSTKATNLDNDTLLYQYTVSGGRIVGSGSNVSWDLAGAKPGTYTITSAADNGCGFCGKTKTETIEVKECTDCIVPCNCPTLTVSGPGSEVAVGDMMTFTANASGGTGDGLIYNWTVSGGTIAEGQGTPVIKVSGAKCDNVTATVEIGGSALCPDGGCKTTASDSGSFACPAVPTVATKVNEQGKAVDDDVKKALQDIRDTDFQSDPTATLYIINRGSAKEKAVRVRQLNKAIPFLGMDASRIKIVDGGSAPALVTEYYMVPAGAQNPQ